MYLPKPSKPKPGPKPRPEDSVLRQWSIDLDRAGLKPEAIRREIKRRLWRAGKALERGDTARKFGGFTAFEIGLIVMEETMQAWEETSDFEDCSSFVEGEPPVVLIPDLRKASKELITLAWRLHRLHRQSWYDRLDKYLGK